VCRGCSLRTICWERDYAKTYNALNDATPALLTQGRGRGRVGGRDVEFPGVSKLD